METKEFKSFYKRVGENEGNKCHYPTRLDPYGCGCQHDCSYCYAKSLLDFRNLWDASNPSVANPKKIWKKVANLPRNEVVRIGGMTDPFQPLELKYGVTYELLKALKHYRVPYLIVTKGDLVAKDRYIEVLDKELAHIQITITTTDDDLSRTYEKAAVPSRRIAAVEKLNALGFDVQVRLSPFIPEYVDINAINAIKCDKIIVEFLRVNTWIRKWFDIDYSEYTLQHAGYRHLPLEKKKEYLSRITGFQYVSVCEDVDEHYNY